MWGAFLVLAGVRASAQAPQAPETATPPPLEQLLAAVVQIKTFINPDARTRENLGGERQGSGIVIDNDGLVLTIGYLMLEAHAVEIVTSAGRTVPANVVGYDHETGFGLLKAAQPLKLTPLALGKSAEVKEREPVLIASAGGPQMVAPAYVIAKREFAGYWEYLLDEAIFTTPPHPAWSGAALINREGKLVGVGSLIVPDATGNGDNVPGNMFVPIDLLPPILADLIADGRSSSPPHPWIGITSGESGGRVIVVRVTPGGPAEKAGLQKGDVIVGVGGAPVSGLADLYRKVWATGQAGVRVPLDVISEDVKRRIEVPSVNRMDYLKLKSTF
jgi:S1-C subfamily serine protease